MTNSVFEGRGINATSVTMKACDTCGGLTAWTRCVMCGGQFDYHCPQGKHYPSM